MIVSAVVYLAGSILVLLANVFAGISFYIPLEFQQSITYFFDKAKALDFLFPVSTLLASISVLLTFFGFLYLIKIVLWIVSFIPGVGHKELPHFEESKYPYSYTYDSNTKKAIGYHNRFKKVIRGKGINTRR